MENLVKEADDTPPQNFLRLLIQLHAQLVCSCSSRSRI